MQVLALLVTLVSSAVLAAEAPRPRVGLVLSGGGARGAAHVGVLKVLEELRVPIDAISGTSMGAVVGGLYASGLSATEIEKLISSVNWQDAFQDRPPRAELGFRRKQDDRNFLVRYALGVTEKGFTLPTGLVQGQKLEQVLRNASLPVAAIDDFDRLPIPFRALATDLETGEAVVMDSGDLVTAMRASMSAPGVFSPAPRGGRLLVDGGLVENLPIDAARAMGVDVLIVVDVSFPLYQRDQLASPIEVTNQAFAILIRNRTLEQRRETQSNRHRHRSAARSCDFRRLYPSTASVAGRRVGSTRGATCADGTDPRRGALSRLSDGTQSARDEASARRFR